MWHENQISGQKRTENEWELEENVGNEFSNEIKRMLYDYIFEITENQY